MTFLEIAVTCEEKQKSTERVAIGVFDLHLCNLPISGHLWEDRFKKIKVKMYPPPPGNFSELKSIKFQGSLAASERRSCCWD